MVYLVMNTSYRGKMRNNNTRNLWGVIKKMGNFSDSYYDKNIELDMKKELGLKKNESLQELQPEIVFSIFFKVMSPLSIMYEDILYLFDCCKANKSSQNIEIVFQSSEFLSARFNIQHFIEAKRKLENVKIYAKKISIDAKRIKNIWSLRSGKNIRENEVIKNELFRKWADEYWGNKDKWPEAPLKFEEIAKNLPISDLLLRSFECWKELFAFYKLTDRINMHNCIEKYSKLERALLYEESDYWLIYSLSGLYYYAENFLSFSESRKEQTRNQLTEFLDAFHIIDRYVEKNIQVWNEFLKLPVWEKRHEVYSIWIFTQIIFSFPRECVTFRIKDETLIFPFSGASLASVKLNKQVFDVWTELRTQAIVTPIGKSRKTAIQPDYSIVCGNENDIKDTVVVVECKQYKKASKKNFSEAIIDYANNRPKAKVFLVDYGEINQERIITAVKNISRSRYDIFPKCRPQNENVAKFSETIRKFLYQYSDIFEADTKYSMRFILSWDGISETQDFDLYLNFIGDDKSHELSHRSQDIDGSKYSGDVRKSPGEEWIKVENWHQGVYDVWVNNYSEDTNFVDGKPVVIVEREDIGRVIELKLEKSYSNKLNWWHIIKIDTRLNIGHIINEMEEQMKL